MDTQQIMPEITPQLLMQSQWDDEYSVFAQQEQQIKSQGLDVEETNAQIAQLQATVDARYTEHTTKMQELNRVQQMAEVGLIPREQAQKAAWTMVLPREVLNAGQGSGEEQGTPFAPSTIMSKSVVGSIKNATDSAFVAPWLGTNYHDPQKLLDSYKKWTNLMGYQNLNPAKKGQLDFVWDQYMTSKGLTDKKNGMPTWSPDHPDVRRIRARGELSNAMANPEGSPLQPQPTTSPFAADLRKQLDAKKAKEQPSQEPVSAAGSGRVKVKSPDGKIGSIPLSQLQAAINAGYTKV